jgi:hypothetical protein
VWSSLAHSNLSHTTHSSSLSQFHRQERRQVPLLSKPLPLLTKPLHLLTKPRSGARRQHRRRAPTQNFTCFTRDLLAQKCRYWRCVANRALGTAARCLAHPLPLLTKPLPLVSPWRGWTKRYARRYTMFSWAGGVLFMLPFTQLLLQRTNKFAWGRWTKFKIALFLLILAGEARILSNLPVAMSSVLVGTSRHSYTPIRSQLWTPIASTEEEEEYHVPTVFNRQSSLVHPTPYSSFVTFLKKLRLYVCDNYCLENSRLLERLAAGAGPLEARLDAPPSGAGVSHTSSSSSSLSSLSPSSYSSTDANAAKAHLLVVNALYCTDGTGQGSACKGKGRARALVEKWPASTELWPRSHHHVTVVYVITQMRIK